MAKKYTDEKLDEIKHEKELKKLLKNKEVKASISALVDEGKYDEVFSQYGRDAYKKFVPGKYRRAELKRLKAEGKFEDIFSKYGEDEYSKVLIGAMFDEIREEKGFVSAALWRAGYMAKRAALTTALFGLAFSAVLPPVFGMATADEIDKNTVQYAGEIEKYNERNKEYAKLFGDVNVSKLQIMMKCMDDMWGSIQGYKQPDINATGYLELDLATEEGYGVCRNMASDVAKRLNAIDPSFNARTLPVKIGEDGFTVADIERTVLQDDETVNDENKDHSSEETKDDVITNVLQNVAGNHMVTLVDIPEDNIILVVDPTNPGLGIYKDGKMIMFNSGWDGKTVEYDSKELTALMFTRGIGETEEIASDFLRSFEKPNLSMDELTEKYGVVAQNQALNQVRALFLATQAEKETAKEPSFEERIKVDISKNTEQKSKEEVSRYEKEAREGDELTH